MFAGLDPLFGRRHSARILLARVLGKKVVFRLVLSNSVLGHRAWVSSVNAAKEDIRQRRTRQKVPDLRNERFNFHSISTATQHIVERINNYYGTTVLIQILLSVLSLL